MMKVGFVSRAFPYDPEKSVIGMYKRMGMFIDAIKRIGELDVLFYVDEDVRVTANFIGEAEERLAKHWKARLQLDVCNLAPLRSPKGRWEEYLAPALHIVDQAPYMQTAGSEQIGAFERMLSRNPDILFVHRLSCMTPVLLSKRRCPPIYFDMDDIEHVAFARSIRQPPRWHGKPLLYLRLPVLCNWERRAIRLSRTTFVCSGQDKDYLARAYRCNNVAVIPNAVEIPPLKGAPYKKNLLFLGALSYLPNRVAADYLIRNIWPLVRSAVPDARLLIAGPFPERTESFGLSWPNVEFLGFVENMEKLYREAGAVCCPILSGGGTRIKILEAAAYGKPVVSTSIGAEGIELRDGTEILLRDDEFSFAEACIGLLENRDLAARIGSAARLAVARLYDRIEVIRLIEECLNGSFAHRPGLSDVERSIEGDTDGCQRHRLDTRQVRKPAQSAEQH